MFNNFLQENSIVRVSKKIFIVQFLLLIAFLNPFKFLIALLIDAL